MIAERDNLTPDELKALAQRWFDRQIAMLSKAHGEHWPEHREWLEDYLRELQAQRCPA